MCIYIYNYDSVMFIVIIIIIQKSRGAWHGFECRSAGAGVVNGRFAHLLIAINTNSFNSY